MWHVLGRLQAGRFNSGPEALAVTIWLSFAMCVALIGIAGVKLSRNADVIAEKTGFGGTWVGLIMLASVTSLPELATGITSVTTAGVPDIAVGDVFGSCVFNVLIIVVLDLMSQEGSVFFRASQGHMLSGAFGVMLLGVAGIGLSLAATGVQWSVGHVGVYSIVILVLYAVAIRTVFLYERRNTAESAAEVAERYPDITLRRAAAGYALAALVVVSTGIMLPFVAAELARQMGWTQSFVGTLFVAFATSLPEIVTTIAAFHIGALDMAISNLFGSNLFNVAILAVDDLFYLPGPLLGDVAPAHGISALSAMVMTGAAIAAIAYRARARLFDTIGWTSIALVALYLLNGYALFVVGNT